VAGARVGRVRVSQSRWAGFGELKIGVGPHPLQKPFGAAFVEKKRMVRPRFNRGDDILRYVAKLGDFPAGEHIVRVVLSDLTKRFPVAHKFFTS